MRLYHLGGDSQEVCLFLTLSMDLWEAFDTIVTEADLACYFEVNSFFVGNG